MNKKNCLFFIILIFLSMTFLSFNVLAASSQTIETSSDVAAGVPAESGTTAGGYITAKSNVKNAVVMDLFKMSLCPYCQQIEKTLQELVEDFNGRFVVKPHFVVTKGEGQNCIYGYCSLHGKKELMLNIVEACVYKKLGEKTYFNFVNNLGESCYELDGSEESSKKCLQESDINLKHVESCLDNKEEILEENAKITQEYNIYGTPTMLFGDENYEGSRDYESLKKEICSRLSKNVKICKDKPIPPIPPIPPKPICLNSCLYKDICLPFGERILVGDVSSYCSIKKEIVPQKQDKEECNNNYECKSNFCSNNKCYNVEKEITGIKKLLDSLIKFLKKF